MRSICNKNINVFAIFQYRNFKVMLADNFTTFWTTGPRCLLNERVNGQYNVWKWHMSWGTPYPAILHVHTEKIQINMHINTVWSVFAGRSVGTEQQIILGVFGYLTPSKFSHLGKITLLFFSSRKDTPKMKSNSVKLIKQKERAQKSLI